MPRPSPFLAEQTAAELQALGGRVRAQRKALRVSASVLAEAAGVSRVTLHRIEKGEPSVTMGAWGNVVAAVGMHLQVQPQVTSHDDRPADRSAWLPVRIALADYPQLKALAWQVQGVDTLTPAEAFDIYERNARHLDMQAMSADEQDLVRALEQVFSREKPGV